MADNDAKKNRPAKNRDGDATARGNIFQRIAEFIRLVIGELKKVVWPTRKELWTYFWVVIIFVAILMTAIFLFDTLFAWLTNLVFA